MKTGGHPATCFTKKNGTDHFRKYISRFRFLVSYILSSYFFMLPFTIRPVEPEKDAAAIAGLIKRSFRPWLALDNIKYLDDLSREGLYAARHPFLSNFHSFPYRLDGVVCRDRSGVLLGLINTYFFRLNGERCCLIANVCVDASRRKEGIASRMLTEVERRQAADGIRNLYLQARLALPETVDFYRKRGYLVTDYRENWVYPKKQSGEPGPAEYILERVPASDRADFERLMNEIYPQTVLWNLNYDPNLFRTGIAAEIANRLESPVNRFRRVRGENGGTAAWAAWQHLSGFADWLWIVPGDDFPASRRAGLLRFLAGAYSGGKPLKIDVPAGGDPRDLENAGFRYWQTLAWMWKAL